MDVDEPPYGFGSSHCCWVASKGGTETNVTLEDGVLGDALCCAIGGGWLEEFVLVRLISAGVSCPAASLLDELRTVSIRGVTLPLGLSVRTVIAALEEAIAFFLAEGLLTNVVIANKATAAASPPPNKTIGFLLMAAL